MACLPPACVAVATLGMRGVAHGGGKKQLVTKKKSNTRKAHRGSPSSSRPRAADVALWIGFIFQEASLLATVPSFLATVPGAKDNSSLKQVDLHTSYEKTYACNGSWDRGLMGKTTNGNTLQSTLKPRK